MSQVQWYMDWLTVQRIVKRRGTVPAVSQIWSLMRLPSSSMVRILKSIPMVVMKDGVKESSEKRSNRQDLPTPICTERRTRSYELDERTCTSDYIFLVTVPLSNCCSAPFFCPSWKVGDDGMSGQSWFAGRSSPVSTETNDARGQKTRASCK